MFYFHEVLKKRGKFGIIWLAATAPKRLSKKDVCTVNVVKSSEDIVEVLTQYPTLAGKRKVRFSLYLSSQLMFGLTSVNNLQANILLSDIRCLATTIGSFRQEATNTIDLQDPVSRFRVTFDEPDFENAPIDFGSFSITDASSVFIPSYEYFLVSTPQSSEEWHISPAQPDQLSEEFVDVGDAHTVRHEDVTMPEEVPAPSEEPFPEDIVIEVPYKGFLDVVLSPPEITEFEPLPAGREVPERVLDIPRVQPVALPVMQTDTRIPPRPDAAAEQPPLPVAPDRELLVTRDQQIPVTIVPVTGPEPAEPRREITRDQQIPEIPIIRPELAEPRDQQIPDVPVTRPELAEPRDQQIPEVPVTRPELADQQIPATRQAPAEPRREEPSLRDQTRMQSPEKAKRSLFDVPEPSETSFVLGPAPPIQIRQRRRRYLIIDPVTTIPPSVLRRNIERANLGLVMPLRLPSTTETAQSLLSRFGSRAAAHGNNKFWRKLRTLPEPDDLSRFGAFGEEPSEVTSGMLAEDTVMTDVVMDQTRYESREDPRAEDTRESLRDATQVDLSGAPSRLSRLSKALQDSREQISSTRRSTLQVPDISVPGASMPDISGISMGFDEFADISAVPLLTESTTGPPILIPETQREARLLAEQRAEPPTEQGAELPTAQRAELPTEQEAELPAEQEMELPAEHEAMQYVPAESRKRSETCVVSPEKTPPPSSPPLPTSPLVEQAMTYIKAALNESPEPNLTTFTSVLSKTPMTRMYVAKMFGLLLSLHESGVIYIQQPVPGGEIFISKGSNFNVFLSSSSNFT